MRVIIPNYCSPDSFAENVAYTLRAMGHEVLSFPRPRVLPIFTSVGRLAGELKASLIGTQPSAQERWLIPAIRRFRPDMILAVTQSLSAEALRAAGALGVRYRVAWWGDAPANMKRWGLLTGEWDLVCLKDGDAVQKFRLAGQEAVHLPEAMNPAWHRPLATGADRAVVIAGSHYAFRQRVSLRLLQSGVDVRLYGPPLPRWAIPELRAVHTGRYLLKEEKSRVFGSALACVNTAALAEGNAVNCRTFEVAGAGGLQLAEDRPAIADCFEPGKEIWTFSTFEQLRDLITRAERSPAEAASCRQAAAARALAEHTYGHRLRALLRHLGA